MQAPLRRGLLLPALFSEGKPQHFLGVNDPELADMGAGQKRSHLSQDCSTNKR
jgi:hypothetical protein